MASTGIVPPIGSTTVVKYKYPLNMTPMPSTHDANHSPGLNPAGTHIFGKYSNLLMAIVNQNDEKVDDILKPHYKIPEKPGQVLWSYCSLCHKASRRLNTKKLVYLAQNGLHEIAWRVTPDFLDLGYIVNDSLGVGYSNRRVSVASFESALAVAINLGSRDVIQKLIWAGVCLNCLEACPICYMDVDRYCQCTAVTPYFHILNYRSKWEEVEEIVKTFILMSGEVIPIQRCLSTNLYLKDAACAGSFKAIQLLIESGEDPARLASDGSTAVSAALRSGFDDLEHIAAIILHMIQCHQMYSAKVMDDIMYPGNSLDFRRWPTLEFIMRMIITAIFGEWDWKHIDLVRIDVLQLFHFEDWMKFGMEGFEFKGQLRKDQECAVQVLYGIMKFPSATKELGPLTLDWVQYLFQHSLETPLVHPSEQPMSLKETARFVIRRNIKAPLHQSLDKLPMPQDIKDYILMQNELSGLVDVRKIINLLNSQ